MRISELSLSSNILSIGSLLGSSGSQELIQSINHRCGGGSFFGSESDPLRTGFVNFMNTVIEPIRQVRMTMAATVNKLMKADVYRPIDSLKELEAGIPSCMQMGIVYYEPVRQMLEEERIDGFGIDPKTLEDEDPYASLIASGKVEIHSSLLNDKGEFEIQFTEKSTDPDLSFEEIRALDQTRQFIDQFLNDEITSSLDFTDYPNLHA